jgi:hypothetical protein
MRPDGIGFVALTGSATNRETDETRTRCTRIILDPALPAPYLIIDDQPTDDDRIPTGTAETEALAFLETDGEAVWHTSTNKLVGTLQA